LTFSICETAEAAAEPNAGRVADQAEAAPARAYTYKRALLRI
jgi:hypothetical protein